MKMKNYIQIILIILLLPTGMAAQQLCGDISLNDAKKLYDKGSFKQVIKTIDPCLNSGYTVPQKLQAYKLLALSYLEMDSIENAYNTCLSLLNTNPNFETSFFDPPKFTEIIQSIKQSGVATLVTSVSKKAENFREAPATVMIITQDDIKQRGYIDLEQLFSDVPGIDISRTYGITYSNIYQRGYRSDNTDRTLFLIDGIEDNDLWSNIAYISRQYPISNVKRIEIVYGPASTMYGANAFVGVVNVITKDPDEITGKNISAHLNTGYGTYNTGYADLTIAKKFKNISFSLTGRKFLSDERDLSVYPEFDYSPDFYDGVDYKSLLSVTSSANAFVKDNSITSTNNFFNIITDANGDTTAANLTDYGEQKARELDKNAFTQQLNGSGIGYSNLSDHYFIAGKMKIQGFKVGFQSWKNRTGNANYYHDNKRMGADNGSLWVQKHSSFYIHYSKDLSENLSIQNLSQYRMTEVDDETKTVEIYNYSNRKLRSVNILTEDEPYFNEFTIYIGSRQFRNELKAIYSPISNIDIVTGFEVRNSFIQGDYLTTISEDESAMEVGTYSGDQKGGSNYYNIFDIGYYLQGTYVYKDMINLTLGGRYDYNRIRKTGGYGSQFNPRIALVAHPGKFIGKAIFASAFQNSSIYKMFSTTDKRIENPTLAPEKVQNLEISLGYNFNKKLFADVVYFNSNYTDVVGAVSGLSLENGKSEMYRNIGALKIQGIQSTINYSYKNYRFYANYTFTDPKNNILDNDKLTGEYQTIADIAPHKINLGINAVYFDKLNLNLRFNYTGSKPVGENTTVSSNPGDFPAYTLIHGTLGYNNILPGLGLQVICNNILNTEYFDPGIRSANVATYAYRLPQHERYFIFRIVYDL
jgi:outer membrane receptor for ferrienterochelin and colicins